MALKILQKHIPYQEEINKLLQSSHTKVLQKVQTQITEIDFAKKYPHDSKYKDRYLYILKSKLGKGPKKGESLGN